MSEIIIYSVCVYYTGTIHFMSEIIIYSVCVYYTGVYYQLHTDNQVKLYIL